MENLLKILNEKHIELPADLLELLAKAKSFSVFQTVEEIAAVATGHPDQLSFDVIYDVPGVGQVTEAVVHRVKNGISANYPEKYMRRRDPDTMAIGDDLPSDKVLFRDKYGSDFASLRKATLDWLGDQDLAVFFYFAGQGDIGAGGIAIAPANAAFFSMGLAMLQKIMPLVSLPEGFPVESVIYVAPPFRHTHFGGKQVVVHNRSESLHEVFSYNLYPGPSAKKGLYGVLLYKGTKEGWITAHCSAVQVFSPYDNYTNFMHEGASGGGKSEMFQHLVRETQGHVLIGENIITGEKRHMAIPLLCTFRPVADDMAMCHPSIQRDNGKLTILDAENGWFLRLDSVTEYGKDPFLEKLAIQSKQPLLFLNIETQPGCTALPWDHIEDEPGVPCPNPRMVIPREMVPGITHRPINIDVRSFGVRTPPFSREQPSYAIIGIFHILPPALAWLWRLVAPRGHGSPSIVGGGAMESEGVGSYWPFATGKMVDQANLLLDQIIQTPRTRYTLTANQYIGVWKVDFKPQLLMREYLTRRGNAKFRTGQYQPARCPLLGYEMNQLSIEGSKVPTRFLKVYRQIEVGTEGYDQGAKLLYDFFRAELPKFLTEGLNPTGKEIIQACLDGASLEDYKRLLPMDYQYSFFADKSESDEKFGGRSMLNY
jgi:hypothetical protein